MTLVEALMLLWWANEALACHRTSQEIAIAWGENFEGRLDNLLALLGCQSLMAWAGLRTVASRRRDLSRAMSELEASLAPCSCAPNPFQCGAPCACDGCGHGERA